MRLLGVIRAKKTDENGIALTELTVGSGIEYELNCELICVCDAIMNSFAV